MRVPPGPKRVKNDVQNVNFMENFENLRIDQDDHRWFQGASGRRSERQRLPKNTPAWEIRNVPKSPQTHHIWPRKWFKISNFLVLTHNIPTNVIGGILINYSVHMVRSTLLHLRIRAATYAIWALNSKSGNFQLWTSCSQHQQIHWEKWRTIIFILH